MLIEYRVTLPADAPRTHHRLRDVMGYPGLVFDARQPLDLPEKLPGTSKTGKSKTIPRDLVDRLKDLGGQPLVVYLRQAIRRDSVDVPSDVDWLDHIPRDLFPELRAQVELSTAAPSKTLHLSPREVRDLHGLGFVTERVEAAGKKSAEVE